MRASLSSLVLALLAAIAPACQPADDPASATRQGQSCSPQGPPCGDGLSCCPGAVSGVPPMPGQSPYQDHRCKPAPCPPAIPMPGTPR